MVCITCVCHSRQVQQNYTHLLFQWSRRVCYSPADLVWKKKSSCSVVAEGDKHVLGVCMLISAAKCLAVCHVCNAVHFCSFIWSFLQDVLFFFLWIKELLKLFSCCTLHGLSRHTLNAAWQRRLFGRICGINRRLPAEHVNLCIQSSQRSGEHSPVLVSCLTWSACSLVVVWSLLHLLLTSKGENACTFSKFKGMNSEFAVSFRACIYWVCGQKHKDLWFLCLEMTVLISLSVTGGILLFF